MHFNESVFLAKCLSQVEKKFAMGPAALWTETTFKILSDHISSASKRNISINTLRRLFGRTKTDEDYMPQMETRNALAIYIGFKDWYEFCHLQEADTVQNKAKDNVPLEATFSEPTIIPVSELAIEKEQVPEEVITHNPTTIEKVETGANFGANEPIRPNGAKILSKARVIGILGSGIGLILFFWWLKRTALSEQKKINITITDTAGYAPTVVIFKIDLTDTDLNNLHFDYGDKSGFYPNLAIETAPHLYKYSGIFSTKLTRGDAVLAGRKVFVRSKGWQRIAEYNGHIYYFPENTRLEEIIGLTQKKSLEKSTDHFRTQYRYFDTLKINADSFRFKAEMTSKIYNTSIDCFAYKLKFYAETGTHEICLIRPGCERFTYNLFSDSAVKGTTENLPLGVDLAKWKQVAIESDKGKVKVIINDKLEYETSYSKPMGKLLGVALLLDGHAKIKNMDLTNIPDGYVVKYKGSSDTLLPD